MPARQWRRSFASDVDLLEPTTENSLKETGSIETALENSTPQPVPVYNPNAAREAALTDPTVAENWYARKHLGTLDLRHPPRKGLIDNGHV